MSANQGAIIMARFSRYEVRRIVDLLTLSLVESGQDEEVPLTFRIDAGEPTPEATGLDRWGSPKVVIASPLAVSSASGVIHLRFAR